MGYTFPVVFTGKRITILASAVILLGVIPLLMLSNGAMTWYQARIDRAPDSGFHRWLQMASADACRKTWRPELASLRYRRYMELYPADEARPVALFYLARSLEEAGRIVDARKTYERFIEEYPDRAEKADCEVAIVRIKYPRGK